MGFLFALVSQLGYLVFLLLKLLLIQTESACLFQFVGLFPFSLPELWLLLYGLLTLLFLVQEGAEVVVEVVEELAAFSAIWV